MIMGKSQSENDGVVYRRAKLWQIVLVSCNAFNGMGVYMLMSQASYAASIGFGISTAVIGVILMGTRLLDAVTDPMLAFLYDRVNTPWGKIRPLLLLGWLIQSLGILGMFHFLSSKGFGVLTFTALYVVYIIGYTIVNMTAQTFGVLLTNDPGQRPTLSVWNTTFTYIVPMVLSIFLANVVLPMAGGEYNQTYLTIASWMVVGISLAGVLLACIGITPVDKPEYFSGIGKQERLKIRDIVDVLAHNKPLQCYIAAQASDKIAQVVASQSIITTMLYGIVIGNVGIGSIISALGMFPSIIFAVIGARYAGKKGNKEGIVTWTSACIVVTVITILFFVVLRNNTHVIAQMGIPMILFIILVFLSNGTKMAVTTSASAFMADVIDYEMDRSGKFIPAVVSGAYSLLDKIISSFGTVMATGAVALIGYTDTVPQPTDPLTPGVFWMTLALMYVLPIIGWIITLIAMKPCKLSKAEMVEVQKRIAARKEAASAEAAAS